MTILPVATSWVKSLPSSKWIPGPWMSHSRSIFLAAARPGLQLPVGPGRLRAGFGWSYYNNSWVLGVPWCVDPLGRQWSFTMPSSQLRNPSRDNLVQAIQKRLLSSWADLAVCPRGCPPAQQPGGLHRTAVLCGTNGHRAHSQLHKGSADLCGFLMSFCSVIMTETVSVPRLVSWNTAEGLGHSREKFLCVNGPPLACASMFFP